MKTTYTVPEVSGSKRQSARPYTHAVTGFYDAERVIRNRRAEHEANIARERRYETKNWNDWKREAEAVAGEFYVNHNGYRVVAEQAYIDIAKKFTTKHPTLEGYLDHVEADFEAEVVKTRESGNQPLTVLRWSQSAANAQKGLGEFERFYSDLRVVECVPVQR